MGELICRVKPRTVRSLRMFELQCTVRNCSHGLRISRPHDGPASSHSSGEQAAEASSFVPRSLVCDAGHCFDRAKHGYWSLLQPQDRKSSNPGDCDEAVLARARWLDAGHCVSLIETLRGLIDAADWELPENQSAVRCFDLGCGEGTFGEALFRDGEQQYCGVDLSRRALRLACRRWPDATWVLANADRRLPVADASVHKIASFFGRRPTSEISRILAPGGLCVVAVPGEDDLIQLREAAQSSGKRRDRCQAIVDEMSSAGLVLQRRDHWRHEVLLGPEGIADAMAMTYRAVRHSQRQRIAQLTEIEATLAADILLFRKPGGS